MNMRRFEAVLFDVDGTLIDSNRRARRDVGAGVQ